MIDLNNLIRENIRSLAPYSSARNEFSGEAGVFLDANENPYGTLNRYPDPNQSRLKEAIGKVKGVDPNSIFIGNGSDEVIDLLFRIFCNPGKDKALTFSPTYGMYDVSAAINNIELLKLELDETFNIVPDSIAPFLEDSTVKLLLICSPNNPTGNCLNSVVIDELIRKFNGIVLLDEAYIEFSEKRSFLDLIDKSPNLVVSQTMSKARGLAAARLGIAYSNPELIELLNKVKPPYNVSELNQLAGIAALENVENYERILSNILAEKAILIDALQSIELVKHIYPSDANFLLVEMENANAVYNRLVELNIVVRNRNLVVRNCLRISIGTPQENQELITALNQIEL